MASFSGSFPGDSWANHPLSPHQSDFQGTLANFLEWIALGFIFETDLIQMLLLHFWDPLEYRIECAKCLNVSRRWEQWATSCSRFWEDVDISIEFGLGTSFRQNAHIRADICTQRDIYMYIYKPICRQMYTSSKMTAVLVMVTVTTCDSWDANPILKQLGESATGNIFWSENK